MKLASFVDNSPKYLKVTYPSGMTWTSSEPIKPEHRAEAEREYWYVECQIDWVNKP